MTGDENRVGIERDRLACWKRTRTKRRMGASQLQQSSMERQALGVQRVGALAPAQLARREGCLRLRVRQAFRRGRMGELRKALEFTLPPLDDQASKIRSEIGEELKRRACRPFLSHEQQWGHRGRQQHRDRGTPGGGVRRMVQPIAKGAVANLIMVLHADD